MNWTNPVDGFLAVLIIAAIASIGVTMIVPQCGQRTVEQPVYRQKCVCREGVHQCDKCHADSGCYCVPKESDGCCRANPKDSVELEPTAEKPCPCPGGYLCETCPFGPCHCHPTKGDFYKAIDAWNRVKASFPFNVQIPNDI